MFAVCRAIHIRTGQRARSEAIDRWLSDHDVEITAFSDVYEACVHLLKHFDQIPDMALVGADWLAEPELAIVRYIHETWPRVGIVVYSGPHDMPTFGFSPLVMTCCSKAAFEKLCAQTPTETLQMLTSAAVPITLARPRPEPALRNVLLERSAAVDEPPPARHRDAGIPSIAAAVPDTAGEQASDMRHTSLSDPKPPHPILTAEELTALLDKSEEG